MKGRNSTVVSIRILDTVNTKLKELADKRGCSVSAFVKSKVEEYVQRVNTTNPTNHSVNTNDYVLIGGVRYKKPKMEGK